jgi:hypothetical protein
MTQWERSRGEHAPPVSAEGFQELLDIHPLLAMVGLGQALGNTADLQQTMFHGAGLIHNFRCSPLTLGGDALQTAG